MSAAEAGGLATSLPTSALASEDHAFGSYYCGNIPQILGRKMAIRVTIQVVFSKASFIAPTSSRTTWRTTFSRRTPRMYSRNASLMRVW